VQIDNDIALRSGFGSQQGIEFVGRLGFKRLGGRFREFGDWKFTIEIRIDKAAVGGVSSWISYQRIDVEGLVACNQ